jgi:hypothetical protein
MKGQSAAVFIEIADPNLDDIRQGWLGVMLGLLG